MSEEKAARIANVDRHQAWRKGGNTQKHQEWTRGELYGKAKEVGIAGRSSVIQSQLIEALRHR